MRRRTPLALLSLACATLASAQSLPGEGELLGPGERKLPLERTEVRAEVSGPVARVVVRQTFQNPFAEAIEAVYVFPLPDRAAVDALTIELGMRCIQGEIRRREDAEKEYAAARAAGRTAALLTEERPNVFTQHVANVLPGERVVVELRYVEDLRYKHGRYRLVFPMTVGPRFVPPGAETSAAGLPTGDDDYLPPGFRLGAAVDLAVAVDAGVRIRSLASTSHRIEVKREGDSFAVVTLAADDRIPNKDFDLAWEVAGAEPKAALLAHKDGDEGSFTLMVQPDAAAPEGFVTPREVFLVLDCSGSMSGAPLAAAKAVVRETLARLHPSDAFQVLQFADATSTLAPAPLPATPENVARGLAWVEALSGSGGTRMIAGLRAALAGERDPGRLRVVHFLTDGYLGNDFEFLAEAQRLVGGARIFPLGVGSSPNRFLIDRLARLGRGAPAYIRHDAGKEAVAREVDRFVERVRRPCLTDLEIDWQGIEVLDVLPATLPDLFAGQPVVVHGRYRHPAAGAIVVRGTRGGAPWEQRVAVTLPEQDARHAALPSLWARARIAELALADPAGTDASVQGEIAALGLRFHLLTAHTAFVAIDEQIVVEGGARRVVRQPLLVPEGMAREADHNESDNNEEWEESKGENDGISEKHFEGTRSNDSMGFGGGSGGALGGWREARMIRAPGGGGETRSPVRQAMAWLADQQAFDGSWSAARASDAGTAGAPSLSGAAPSTGDLEVTALALATFLGAGHTHREGELKDTVRKGLKWLRQQQSEDGGFGSDSSLRARAAATLALVEAYAMTKSGLWKGAAQLALTAAARSQAPDGTWGGTGEESLEPTAWMALVLWSGREAGLDVDPAASQKAYAFVQGTRPTTLDGASASILIRIFAGREDPATSPDIKEALAICLANLPAWEAGRIDLAAWHLATLATFQAGGDAWKSWSAAIKPAMVDSMSTADGLEGSWDPLGPGADRGGRVWSTALLTLSLEVYYRYPRVAGSRSPK